MVLGNPALAGVLAVFRQQLSAHFGARLVSVTLFGSYARGEAGPDSDVDVAVVLNRIQSHAERVLPMKLASGLEGFQLTPLVMSQSELDFLRAREDLLAGNLEREGVSV